MENLIFTLTTCKTSRKSTKIDIDTQVFPTLEAALSEMFDIKYRLIGNIKGKFQLMEDDKGNETTIFDNKMITTIKVKQHEIL